MQEYKVTNENVGVRLDMFVLNIHPDSTRSNIKHRVEDGVILVNGNDATVKKFREEIISLGGEVKFNCRMTDIIVALVIIVILGLSILYIIKEKMGKKTFLLDRLFEDIEILNNFFDTFIITDARLIYEFESIRNKYDDVITIKIVRDNYDNELSEEEANHITEKGLDNYEDFDYIVHNNSLDDLENSALEIVRNEENYGGDIL